MVAYLLFELPNIRRENEMTKQWELVTDRVQVYGYLNMQERARAIGAQTAWLVSRFSSGTRFELKLAYTMPRLIVADDNPHNHHFLVAVLARCIARRLLLLILFYDSEHGVTRTYITRTGGSTA